MNILYIMSLILGVWLFFGQKNAISVPDYVFDGTDWFLTIFWIFLISFGINGLFLLNS